MFFHETKRRTARVIWLPGSFHLFPLTPLPHSRIRVANLLDSNNGGGDGDKWLIILLELLA